MTGYEDAQYIFLVGGITKKNYVYVDLAVFQNTTPLKVRKEVDAIVIATWDVTTAVLATTGAEFRLLLTPPQQLEKTSKFPEQRMMSEPFSAYCCETCVSCCRAWNLLELAGTCEIARCKLVVIGQQDCVSLLIK